MGLTLDLWLPYIDVMHAYKKQSNFLDLICQILGILEVGRLHNVRFHIHTVDRVSENIWPMHKQPMF